MPVYLSMCMDKKIIFFYSCLSFCAFAVLYLLILSIPENPIKLRYPFFSQRKVTLIAPQGWSFFTKNPRDEDIYLYRIEDTELHPVSIVNMQASQVFGVDRENRLISTKLLKITGGIPAKNWLNYRGDVAAFVKSMGAECFDVLNMRVKEPSLCGRYCVVLQKPVPWSWSGLDNINMPSRFAIINFNCLEN